jgi:HK97 gp10 family phage protein
MIEHDPQNRRVFIRLVGVEQASRRVIRRAFFFLGRDLRSTASREILRKPKSGRTYIFRTRNGRRRKHVASAPGETHANFSGKLRRSLGFRVNGHVSMEFGYGVDKDAPPYGLFLEFGTVKMAARPSLQNAMRDVERNTEQYFINEFNNESS